MAKYGTRIGYGLGGPGLFHGLRLDPKVKAPRKSRGERLRAKREHTRRVQEPGYQAYLAVLRRRARIWVETACKAHAHSCSLYLAIQTQQEDRKAAARP